jgi:REP element-mobilizing transposase RayT
MHAVLGKLIAENKGTTIAIGGVEDHVHLLARLHQDSAVASVVRAVKAKSSRWMHRENDEFAAFAWQTGYAAFTVSLSQVDRVAVYIRNQEEHHRRQPFDAEYKQMLRTHSIDIPEQLLWE